MSSRDERMIQFRLNPIQNPIQTGGEGEICLLRISAIMCLFPEHRHIRTIENGWTLTVCEADWPKVEKAFRSAYLGLPVHTAEIQ